MWYIIIGVVVVVTIVVVLLLKVASFRPKLRIFCGSCSHSFEVEDLHFVKGYDPMRIRTRAIYCPKCNEYCTTIGDG